jgi:hypothetical protein
LDKYRHGIGPWRQHLNRYLSEYDFRVNHRVKLGFDDATRGDIALKGIVGERLASRRSGAIKLRPREFWSK